MLKITVARMYSLLVKILLFHCVTIERLDYNQAYIIPITLHITVLAISNNYTSQKCPNTATQHSVITPKEIGFRSWWWFIQLSTCEIFIRT